MITWKTEEADSMMIHLIHYKILNFILFRKAIFFIFLAIMIGPTHPKSAQLSHTGSRSSQMMECQGFPLTLVRRVCLKDLRGHLKHYRLVFTLEREIMRK